MIPQAGDTFELFGTLRHLPCYGAYRDLRITSGLPVTGLKAWRSILFASRSVPASGPSA